MTSYLDQIRQLIELHQVDDEILNEQTKLEQSPKELANLKARFATIETQSKEIQEKIATLTEQEKQLTSDIEEDASLLRKKHTELMCVVNDREHHARLREIDIAEKNKHTHEEDRDRIVEDKKLQQTELDDVSKEADNIKNKLKNHENGLEFSLQQAQSRLEKLKKERDAIALSISKPILARYEFIRKRLHHPVIVPVTAGVCGGCHIMIPPQTFIELQGEDKILNCPNCQRLIYWSEHFPTKKDELEEETKD